MVTHDYTLCVLTGFRAMHAIREGPLWTTWPAHISEGFPPVFLTIQGHPELHDMFWVPRMF